jgi:hypothetical protein
LQLSGVPDREPGVKLSKHFSSSAWLVNWKKRQLSLFNHPPARNQQDNLLYVLLDHLCARSDEEGNALQQRLLFTEANIYICSRYWHRFLPQIDTLFERYGRLRTGKCTST